MSKFDLPKKGDYVTIHDCSNFKTVYIVIDCTPLSNWSDNVVQLVYTAECEMHSTKKTINGDFIWDKIRTKYVGAPFFCSNFRTVHMKPTTEDEKQQQTGNWQNLESSGIQSHRSSMIDHYQTYPKDSCLTRTQSTVGIRCLSHI